MNTQNPDEDLELDGSISHLLPSCNIDENPEKFLEERVKGFFDSNLSKKEVFYDISQYYPDKFTTDQINKVIKFVFDSYSREPADYHLTDAGNSERFIYRHGKNLRYCPGTKMKGSWFRWGGKVWKEVGEDSLMSSATNTAKAIYGEAKHSDNSTMTGKWAIYSESLRGRREMIRGAGFHVEINVEDFDNKPELINLENGTYNLEKHTFQSHMRGDFLSKMSSVEFNEEAECPFWEEHLLTIFAGDTETVKYFQEICGYSLLQYNPDQVLFILWGEGKNGKSETIKVLKKIHGDYGINIQSESLIASRKDAGERARPDLVRLKGARLVTVTEPDKDIYLSEGLIKTLTGDETITARSCYCDPIEFKPGGKIFLATNHMPKFSAGGNGIYRRVKKIPFVVQISEAKRKPDYGDFMYESEGSGILNWMLQGLKQYQDRGHLLESTAVKNATLNFRMESSPIGEFLMEECVITLNQDDIVGRKDIYDKYGLYCNEWGIKEDHRIKAKIFANFLKDTGISKGPKLHGNRSWRGIRFKTAEEKEIEEQTGEQQTNL